MKSLQILLIEDDVWLAEIMRRSLEGVGHTVIHYVDAAQAMEAIDQQLPDVIVADVLLGDHTTFALFHELQSFEDTAAVPIVLCSSLTSDVLSTDNLAPYGIVEVIDKAVMTPDSIAQSVAIAYNATEKQL